MDRDLTWELDRQVVLTQLLHVILVLRSSSRFSFKGRLFNSAQPPAEDPLLQHAVDLHNRLLFRSASVLPPVVHPGGPGGAGGAHRASEKESSAELSASTNSAGSLPLRQPSQGEAGYDQEVLLSLRTSLQRTLTEEDILSPFCAICRSPDTSETITSVALSGIVAILGHPCSFITVAGVRVVLEAVAMVRGGAGGSALHEVLTGRIVQAYTACVRHPAAAELAEECYVRAVSRTLVVALRPETSALLKRTAESAMSSIVSTLYSNVIASLPVAAGSSFAFPSPPPAATVTPPPRGLDGTAMLRYISSLIRGEVTALDSEGHTISSGSGDGAGRGATGNGKNKGSSPSDAKGGRTSDAGQDSGRATSPVAVGNGPAIQLEGLWLAQAMLFTVSRHLDDDRLRRLRSALQNDLSRALLIAGVDTTHVVVLSQILRTLHIAVKCAAQHLVPQMLSFLSVLHVKPLAVLTLELDHAESSPTTGGFVLGRGQRFGSPLPQSAALSPVSRSPTAANYLSSAQFMDMYERKEVLVESLAEFFSDASFLSFCYTHYNLAWRYKPILPQLCDALVHGACVYGDPEEGFGGGGSSSSSTGGGAEGGGVAGQGAIRAAGESGSTSRQVRPLNRLQLVALDAMTSMVSELAWRTMASPHNSIVVAGDGAPPISSQASPPQLPPSVLEENELPLTRELIEQGVKHVMTEKKRLLQFASLFEDSPTKKGIPFLLENAVRVDTEEEEVAAARERKTWLVLRNPAGGREVGRALFRLSMLLDKRVLSDHIGDLGRERSRKPAAGEMVAVLPDNTVLTDPADVAAAIAAVDQRHAGRADGGEGVPHVGDNGSGVTEAQEVRLVPALTLWEQSRESDDTVVGTVRFHQEQLKGFIESFDFKGKSLLTAIREMVYQLSLPGEAQKIDRIMEVFAKHWCAQNADDRVLNPFQSYSGAFVLSFAVIMLNTTVHSKRVENNITLSDFQSMNRGTDNGNSVPDEYLSAIYEDVQRHEVIMSEMMDRGFANDVTWDLEMSSAHGPALHGVDGTLNGVLDLMRREGKAAPPQPQQLMPQQPPTLLTKRDAVQLALDPYIFNAVWKRCLLLFSGMVESTGAQVSRLSPSGETIKNAVEHVKAVMPTEMSALLSSLRGIGMLSRTAHALGYPAVADQCMLTLLPHVALELSDAQDVMDGFYRSLPKLLCARKVFSLFRTTAASLADSWPLLSGFLLKLYLLGFFTVQHAEGGAKDCLSSSSSSSTRPASLPDVLALNPGIVGSEAASRGKATTASESNGGGWFSSLFGGGSNNNGGNNNSGGSNKNPRSEPAKSTGMGSSITSQPRVRECIPDMVQLLHSLVAIPLGARKLLLEALIATSGSRVKARPARQALTSQEAFVLSYELCFATAIAFVSPPPSLSAPATEGEAAERSAEASDVISAYIPYLQSTLSRVLEAARSPPQRTRADHTLPDAMNEHWVAICDRVTAGVLRVAGHALVAAHRKTALSHAVGSGGGGGGGGRGPVLLESVWRVLQVFLGLPLATFNGAAALPVACFVEDWAADLAKRAAETGPLPHSHPEVSMLLPLVSRAAAKLEKGVDPAAVACLCRATFHIASQTLYDVSQQTEVLVDTVFALGSVQGQQEDAARGRSPISLTGSRVSDMRDSTPPRSSADTAEAATAAARRAAPPAPPSEVVGLCCRNVVRAARERHGDPAGTSEEGDDSASVWRQLWILCLQRLAGLVLCAGSPRSGSEGLLSLQRALQDTELEPLPVGVIQSIYNDVLFPLVELVCAPGSDVLSSNSTPPLGPLPQQGSQQPTNPSGFLASVFGATQSPAALAESSQPKPPPPQQHTPGRQASLMPIVPAEVKCRVVNLLPKVLLQHTVALAECPELLQDLWQRVIGTLYAVATAFPSASDVVLPGSSSSSPRRPNGSGASSDRDDVEEELRSDEAAMIMEAVEETVKNMVYVVATMETASGSVLRCVPYFSTSTRNLIRPFSFAGPLLAFLDAVEGGASDSQGR